MKIRLLTRKAVRAGEAIFAAPAPKNIIAGNLSATIVESDDSNHEATIYFFIDRGDTVFMADINEKMLRSLAETTMVAIDKFKNVENSPHQALNIEIIQKLKKK